MFIIQAKIGKFNYFVDTRYGKELFQGLKQNDELFNSPHAAGKVIKSFKETYFYNYPLIIESYDKM